MECKDCKYGHLEPRTEDDFDFVCDPPDGNCPYNLIPECHWISEPTVTTEDVKRAKELGIV